MKQIASALVIIVAIVACFKDKIPSINIPTVPAVVPSTPVVEVKGALKEFEAVVSKADKAKVQQLGEFYLAFSDIVSRSSPLPANKLRMWMIDSDSYFIRDTDLVGSVPGVGAAKDKVIEEAIGLEDRMLTKDEMNAVAEALRGMAQVCGVK